MTERGFNPQQVDDPQGLLDELLRRDFTSFLMRAFSYVRGGAALAMNWHLDAIAFQLERVRAGDCRRLLVTLPPPETSSRSPSQWRGSRGAWDGTPH
jgi:hypothetical protein